jgi:hypothetical protein
MSGETLMKRHFADWGYAQHQELVGMCRELPVLERSRAVAFFDAAEHVAKHIHPPIEVPAEAVFSQMGSTLVASDRQDFDVTCEVGTGTLFDGIMLVETFDPVIATLQCVARVGEDSFLTRTFMFEDIAPVKAL